MVSLDERFWYLLLGCAIGYVVRFLQDWLRQRKLRKAAGEPPPKHPAVGDFALLFVIVVTVWAAFSSQRATNELEYTQDRLARISVCNQRFLADTISALNERTTFTRNQIDANVELQRAQSRFLAVVSFVPPVPEAERRAALGKYVDSLDKFVAANTEAKNSIQETPFPTEEALVSCLGSAKEVVQ